MLRPPFHEGSATTSPMLPSSAVGHDSPWLPRVDKPCPLSWLHIDSRALQSPALGIPRCHRWNSFQLFSLCEVGRASAAHVDEEKKADVAEHHKDVWPRRLTC